MLVAWQRGLLDALCGVGLWRRLVGGLAFATLVWVGVGLGLAWLVYDSRLSAWFG